MHLYALEYIAAHYETTRPMNSIVTAEAAVTFIFIQSLVLYEYGNLMSPKTNQLDKRYRLVCIKNVKQNTIFQNFLVLLISQYDFYSLFVCFININL